MALAAIVRAAVVLALVALAEQLLLLLEGELQVLHLRLSGVKGLGQGWGLGVGLGG